MKKSFGILLIFILLSSCEKSQDNNDITLKFYGDALEDIGYSVAIVEDGYIIAGQFTNVARIGGNLIDAEKSVRKMGIIKTGFDGNVIWKKSFGGRLQTAGTKILALQDGSIICTGYAIDSITLNKDIYIVKLAADGTDPLEKIYQSDGNQYGIDIIKTPEGFLLLGSTDVGRPPVTESSGNVAGKKDIFLMRINENLEPVLVSPTITTGFPGNDEGAAIKEDLGGGYIVVGTTDRSDQAPSVQAGNNIFLLRVNSDGSATQPLIIGGTSDEYAADIEVLNDGYIIAGTIGNEGSVQQGYLWKFSDNIYAPPLIAHQIDIDPSSSGITSFSVKAICRYKTNSFVMAGQSGTGSSSKMLVFATDAEGNLLDGKKMTAGGTGIQVIYDVTADEEDNIIAVGKNSFEKNSMISLVKLRF